MSETFIKWCSHNACLVIITHRLSSNIHTPPIKWYSHTICQVILTYPSSDIHTLPIKYYPHTVYRVIFTHRLLNDKQLWEEHHTASMGHGMKNFYFFHLLVAYYCNINVCLYNWLCFLFFQHLYWCFLCPSCMRLTRWCDFIWHLIRGIVWLLLPLLLFLLCLHLFLLICALSVRCMHCLWD